MGATQRGIALVTGAGPGIGRATALALAHDGCDLVVAARRPERLEALAAEIAAQTGRRVEPVPTDIADPADARRVADRAAALGDLVAVVNVATLSGDGAAVADADWDAHRAAYEVNVIGTLEVSRTAASHMIGHGRGGAICQISTLSTHSLPPRLSAYTSTKSAMLAASFTMARELGADGIRVNVVTPGYTTGPNLDAMFARTAEASGRNPAEVSARAARGAALGRHVDPEDVAAAAAFLCSDRARSITGVELRVDAGQWIG